MEIEITRPDDMHLHLRDGAALEAVVGYTARQFGRAIIMPNLKPPVVNTDDAEGEVIEESKLRPDDESLKEALNGFIGDIEQIPPKFSAVKVDGKRAYALARAGKEMELTARPLFVESLLMLDRPDRDHIVLELICGKGGYVRSIARDLGEMLGCFGHVTELRRIWAGPFEVADGLSFEECARRVWLQLCLPISATSGGGRRRICWPAHPLSHSQPRDCSD